MKRSAFPDLLGESKTNILKLLVRTYRTAIGSVAVVNGFPEWRRTVSDELANISFFLIGKRAVERADCVVGGRDISVNYRFHGSGKLHRLYFRVSFDHVTKDRYLVLYTLVDGAPHNG